MTDRWFRMYEKALDDPKVQRLPGELFKTWVNLLCIASKNKGALPEADLGFLLRLPDDEVTDRIEKLVRAELIDLNSDGSVTPHKWEVFQYASDTSADRMKKYRERHRDDKVTSQVTASDAKSDVLDTDTDTDKIIDADASIADEAASAARLQSEEDRKRVVEKRQLVLRSLGERWNTFAGELRLPQIEEIKTGSPRERSALARVRDGCDFDRVFAKIRASPFLRGEKGSTPASFDWITNPTNYQKIIEGNYDEVRKQGESPSGGSYARGAVSNLGVSTALSGTPGTRGG